MASTLVVVACLLVAGTAAWEERLPEEVELETGADDVYTEQYYQDDTEVQPTPHPDWVATAVKDVAYFLRAHKFNDYDRRFFTNPDDVTKPLYSAFPDPPLRTLHWEVNKYCSVGFISCLQYLQEKSLQAELRRSEDSAMLSLAGAVQGYEQVEKADLECNRLRKLDLVGAQPFHGPLERFQWRTTASYFMCWYTMNEVPQLRSLGERCDNHANCMHPWMGPTNHDHRADDTEPFLCATYSFCPDPCCPESHYHSPGACWGSEQNNPCYKDAPPAARACTTKRGLNTHLVSLILGMWNVTCDCLQPGYEWSSRFGMCAGGSLIYTRTARTGNGQVNVNECITNQHSCDEKTQACFNMPGGYECICRWGFLYNEDKRKCVKNELLFAAERGSIQKKKDTIMKKILSFIVPNAIQQTELLSVYFNTGHWCRFPHGAATIVCIAICKLLMFSCIS